MQATPDTFFILGNPRSGTTLFRLMLNSHPQIIVPPECGFIQWWHAQYAGWNKNNLNTEDVSRFIHDLKHSKKIETWKLNYSLLQDNIFKHRPANYAQLCSVVYLTYAQLHHKNIKLWGDKNNYYIQHINEIYEIFPRAKYILIVRDGRDVACSYKNLTKIKTTSIYKPRLPVEIKKIATEWTNNNAQILQFFENYNQQFLRVRYEDIVLNPEIELKKVCAFLNISYHHDMLMYYKNNLENEEEPQEFLAWKQKTIQKPDPGNIGKYKQELTFDEIQEFENIAFPLLSKFNYI